MTFKYGLGWRKDNLDWRDSQYRLQMPKGVKIDEKVDYDLTTLPAMQFPIWEQSHTNACVGTSVARNVQYLMRAQGVMDFVPRAMFLYWAGRALIGETALDDGCMIRDAFKQLAHLGVARERDWPFRADNVKRTPPPLVMRSATEHV